MASVNSKSRLKRYALPACILAIILALLWWFTQRPDRPAGRQGSSLAASGTEASNQNNSATSGAASAIRPALTVTATSPAMQQWEQTLTANGNIAAWQEVVIGSELSGLRLTQVNVNVGDVVKRGQVLAQINTQTIGAELAQAQANAEEARAVLNEATANARRIMALRDTGAISMQEAARYSTSQQTAQARLDAAKAQIDAIKLRSQQAQVVAPDNGVISARTATVGSLAQTGQELFRLIRDNRLEWRAEVTAAELSRLHTGLKVSVYSADASLPPVPGVIRKIAPVIDPQTRYGVVYVDLAANSVLRMGMFSKGIFHLGLKQAMTLPQSSILLRDGFAYVFILEPVRPAAGASSLSPHMARVKQQKVSIGRRLGNLVEVLDLPAHVRVADSGTGFLTDGDMVSIAAKVPVSPLNQRLANQQNGPVLSSNGNRLPALDPYQHPDLTVRHRRANWQLTGHGLTGHAVRMTTPSRQEGVA